MTTRIPLSGKRGEGIAALVDDQDAELVSGYVWNLSSQGRVTAHVPGSGRSGKGGRAILMHQLIAGHRNVDHKDGDPLNNTRGNLRPYETNAQNEANSGSRGGSSRYKGVYWHKTNSRWRARITIDNHSYHLGYFTDEDDAARAYNVAAERAWGEFARLNVTVTTV